MLRRVGASLSSSTLHWSRWATCLPIDTTYTSICSLSRPFALVIGLCVTFSRRRYVKFAVNYKMTLKIISKRSQDIWNIFSKNFGDAIARELWRHFKGFSRSTSRILRWHLRSNSGVLQEYFRCSPAILAISLVVSSDTTRVLQRHFMDSQRYFMISQTVFKEFLRPETERKE